MQSEKRVTEVIISKITKKKKPVDKKSINAIGSSNFQTATAESILTTPSATGTRRFQANLADMLLSKE